MKITTLQQENSLITQYCNQLEVALTEIDYPKSLQRQFIEQIHDSLLSYLELHPHATINDLYSCFGSPQDAADSALLNTDPRKLKKQLKSSQLHKFLFAIIVAFFVFVLLFQLGSLAVNRYVSQPYIIESSAAVITGPLPTDTP